MISESEPLELTLYVRAGCHLCEDMLAALRDFRGTAGLRIRTVDIDEDAALADRFGTRVPVLMHDGQFICEYYLDPDALRRALGTRV